MDNHDEVERETLLSSEDEGANEEIQEDDMTQPVGQTIHEADPSPSKFGTIKRFMTSWPVVELKELLKLSIPTVLMLFFQQFMYIIAILFAGHISGDSRELDAAALGISIINVTGLSLIIGLSSAADTLCPQSFGFKNYERVGEILQQGILILSIAALPVTAIWLNSESLMLILQQPPCVVRLASQIIKIYILALPALIVYLMMQKYLQAQSVVWVFAIAGVLQNVFTALFCALFIYGLKLGVVSISIALVLANYISVTFLLVYVKWRGLHKLTWGGWSFNSLKKWGLFMKLGLPGFCMIAFEWWTFEISVFVSGSIDETQLGVNTVLLQILTICFMLPYGNGTAASVRVGNELGAGNPQRAKRASYTSVCLQCVIAAVLVVSLGLTHDVVARVFTEDEEVIAVSSYTIYAALGVFFFDQVQGAISGVFRGCGRQLLAASINFVVFYVIGLPLGISLALLAHLDTLGMWIGLAIASFLQASIFFVILITTNWEKQAKRAMKNAAGESPSVSSISDETDSVEDDEKKPDSEEPLSHYLARESLGTVDLDPDVVEEEIPLVSYEDVEEPLVSVSGEQATLANESEPSPSSTHRKERVKLLLSKGSFVLIGLSVVVIGAVLAGVFRHDDLISYCESEGNSSCDLYCMNASSVYDLTTEPNPVPTTGGSTVQYISNSTINSSGTNWRLMPTPTPVLLSCVCSVGHSQSSVISPTPFYSA